MVPASNFVLGTGSFESKRGQIAPVLQFYSRTISLEFQKPVARLWESWEGIRKLNPHP